jgi:hypothetical protein
MEPSPHQTLNKKGLFPIWMMLALIIFFICSCNDGKTKYSFLKLDSATLAPYYNAPDFNKIVFQFVDPDINSNQDAMKLIGYALDKNYNIIGDPFVLAYASDSIEKTFDSSAIYGNLELTKSNIDAIIKAKDSSIVSYQYLLFQPDKLTSNQISYNIFTRPKDIIIMGQATSTSLNPSPPAKPGIMLK